MKKPLATEQLKIYLGYLDKEMTIMGILSSFCILVLGFVSERIFFPPEKSVFAFWQRTAPLCVAGQAALLLAASSFYSQRSLLAWFYGQLSLYQAKEDVDQVHKLLEDSDGWYTWRRYQAGLGLLVLSFGELGLAVLSSFIPYVEKHQLWLGGPLLGLVVLFYLFVLIAYADYPQEDRPLHELWKSIFRSKKPKTIR